MKRHLFMYLFVFSVCINLFTYMYLTGQNKQDAKRIESIQKKLQASRDSLATQTSAASFFSLENNIYAQGYLKSNGIEDFDKFAIKVTDGITQQNGNPNGNPLVGYESLDDHKYIINRVKLLNHRWVIADFDNGSTWGEVLIRYFINEDGTISYERADSLLYPNNL
ncbi:hypothetical protein ACLI1A_05275 [Flavobacterium sp. RHBU_3]|uniref:hypothetical protein n=1 Tax=Flavobacterium sp. RHBU_3 TaxID=3391184 RepID=UPI0039852452